VTANLPNDSCRIMLKNNRFNIKSEISSTYFLINELSVDYSTASMQLNHVNDRIPYYTPLDRPFGLTYGTWTVKWWDWVTSIPTQINPGMDPNGRNANMKQKEQVWFLAGSFPGEGFPSRKCVISEDKSVLFPVVNYEINTYEKPEITTKSEMLEDVINDIDGILEMKVTIDGIDIPCFRIKSDPDVFSLTLAEGNCLGLPCGTIDVAADGYWVFLKPLPPGKHEIEFYGLCPGEVRLGAHYELFVK
jgi:hypothetical protein